MIPHFFIQEKKMLEDKHPNWGEIHSQKKKIYIYIYIYLGRNSLSN